MTLIVPKIPQPIKYSYRDKIEHMSWCLKNGIRIYILPQNYRIGNIVVEINGKPNVGEHDYILNEKYVRKNDEKYWEIIYKLYTEKYERAHKRRKKIYIK